MDREGRGTNRQAAGLATGASQNQACCCMHVHKHTRAGPRICVKTSPDPPPPTHPTHNLPLHVQPTHPTHPSTSVLRVGEPPHPTCPGACPPLPQTLTHLSRGTSGGADPALTPTLSTRMPSAASSGTAARVRPGTSLCQTNRHIAAAAAQQHASGPAHPSVVDT